MIRIQQFVTSKVIFLTLGDHFTVVLLRTYKAIYLFHILYLCCESES